MGNLFMLPTENLTQIGISKITNRVTYNKNKHDTLAWFNNQNLYITSDEEPQNNEWCLVDDKEVEKYCVPLSKHRYRKIVLTTDEKLIKEGIQSIETSFLVWFTNNSDCKFVEVKREIKKEYVDDQDAYGYDVPVYKIPIPNETWLEKHDNLETAKQLEVEAKELCEEEQERSITITNINKQETPEEEKFYSQTEMEDIVKKTINQFCTYFSDSFREKVTSEWIEKSKK